MEGALQGDPDPDPRGRRGGGPLCRGQVRAGPGRALPDLRGTGVRARRRDDRFRPRRRRPLRPPEPGLRQPPVRADQRSRRGASGCDQPAPAGDRGAADALRQAGRRQRQHPPVGGWGSGPDAGAGAREELAARLHRRGRRSGEGRSVPRRDRASREGTEGRPERRAAHCLPGRVRHRLLRRSAALRKRGGGARGTRYRGGPRPRARRLRRGCGSRRAPRGPLRRGLPLARRGGADAGRATGWCHPAGDLRRLWRHHRPRRLGHRQGRWGRGEPGQQARSGAARAQPDLLRKAARVRARTDRRDRRARSRLHRRRRRRADALPAAGDRRGPGPGTRRLVAGARPEPPARRPGSIRSGTCCPRSAARPPWSRSRPRGSPTPA